MNSTTTWGLLSGGLIALCALSCTQGDAVTLGDKVASRAVTGGLRLALTVGELEFDSVTAVLSRAGHEKHRQEIDVRGSEGVIAAYFGDLPEGSDYSIELTAGDCSGSSQFEIMADVTTSVEVTLECAAGQEAGSAQIIGTFGTSGSAPGCNLVRRIVAAPSVQAGEDRESSVELVLEEGVAPTSVVWAYSSSPSGGRGSLLASGKSDLQVAFDCATDGELEIVATVTAISDGRSCSQEARASIECVDQAAVPPPAEAPQDPDPAELGACGRCSLDHCGAQLAVVNANRGNVGPVIDCVLGDSWQAGQRASAASCGNVDLFACYCGSEPGSSCVSTAPSALDGQCRDQILAGTGCTESSCVQTLLNSVANAAGKVMQYVRCQQDFCYDFCFNP